MKKKKGFTLIELLAVIVILAIIALIATPIVLNLIEKARLGSAKDSAYGVRKAAQLYYQAILIDDVNAINDSITISFNNGTVTSSLASDVEYKIDGTVPKSGNITITKDGEISGSVVINNYVCSISNSENVECGKKKKYENGEIVYFNPVNNEQCSNYNEDNSLTNYKGDEASKTTNKQNGCMRWFAYLDDENATSVKLLADHNTTARIPWNDENNNVELENSNLQSELDELTSENGHNWKVSVTIISAYDVAIITGYEETNEVEWTNSSKWYVLETNTNSRPNIYNGKYWWLYDRLSNCTDYGCHVNDNIVFNDGYWTRTIGSNNNKTWRISRDSSLYLEDITSSYMGIRPVIMVSKSKLN